MTARVNFILCVGFVFFNFLSLAFVLPSPVLADHDEYPPDSLYERDMYFYENVYPYRRHWHSKEISPHDPLTRSQIIKRTQEQNRAKALARSRELKEIQERSLAKYLKRSLALKEFQERNKAKFLERSRELKEIQERSLAKFLERSHELKEIQKRSRAKFLARSRTLKEILEQNKADALENRKRRKNGIPFPPAGLNSLDP